MKGVNLSLVLLLLTPRRGTCEGPSPYLETTKSLFENYFLSNSS